MWPMEKNIAEKSVAMQAAKTWKSRVNAIICLAPCHIGSSRAEAPLTWPAENICSGLHHGEWRCGVR